MHIFSVRGRPVGFEPGNFGGALVAVERGYFPVSSTGYRSLAGHFGLSGVADPTTISGDFLEALAVAQDNARRSVLRRLGRVPAATSDRLANFITVSMDADSALSEGFFATDTERFALWRGAYRLLYLIDCDPRFQPMPSSTAWNASACAQALGIRREMLSFVRQLAAGELPTPPELLLATDGYYALPVKDGGEPRFELPALTPELPLDLPPVNFDDEPEPDIEDAEPFGSSASDPAQMTLL